MKLETLAELRLKHIGKRMSAFRTWRKGKEENKHWKPIILKVSLQLLGDFAFFSVLCKERSIHGCKLKEYGKCNIYKCPKVLVELNRTQKKYKI